MSYIDRDLTFNEDEVIPMGNFCFDVLIIDDEENEQDETQSFYLYFHNGSRSHITDTAQITIYDNDEG